MHGVANEPSYRNHHFYRHHGEIFHKSPALNRLILKQVGQSAWEITKSDSERPNNLREVAERSAGKFAYERNSKRGFEALSGYVIDSDEQIKVVYRLPSD